MIPRLAMPEIESALRHEAAVTVTGPRQAGKSTLARAIAARVTDRAPGCSQGALYLDLEDSDDRARLAQPGLFLDSVADRLVILDTIHRMPTLVPVLSGILDQGRRQGQRGGRFLILGSASLDLLRPSGRGLADGKGLAGRIPPAAQLALGPLSALEIADDPAARARLWLRGGLPHSYDAASDTDSLRYRKGVIRAALERDVPMLGRRVPADMLERLWTMLAHRQGAVLNAAEIGRALEVSPQTVTRAVDLLADLLLVRRLPAYQPATGRTAGRTIRKRLVKSPKVYIRDSGLVHALLGIATAEQLAGHPVVAQSWEGLVLETLLTALPRRSTAAFYRTAAGAAADLVLTHGDGTLWAIAIKRDPAARPGRGFTEACADLQPDSAFIVHQGETSGPITQKNIRTMGLRPFAERLRQLGA